MAALQLDYQAASTSSCRAAGRAAAARQLCDWQHGGEELDGDTCCDVHEADGS